MPTDRVLIEIITAANMAGINEAKTGMLGVSKSTLALAAGLGILVVTGKAAIANTEAMDKAHLGLQQAADTTHKKFSDLQSAFDDWSQANKRYIADQYDAEDAFAHLIRSGLSASEAMRALNDALDLAVIKGIPVTDAQKMITLALTGSTKGTKELGITTAELTKITKSHLTPAQKHAAILALIEKHTKDGRKATTDLAGSTQALNHDWQDITTKVGPPLIGLLSGVIGAVDGIVGALDALGKNTTWNAALKMAFGDLQEAVVNDVQWIEHLLGLLGIHIPGPKGSVGKGAQAGVGAKGSKPGGMVGAGASALHKSAPVVINIHGGVFADHGPTMDKLANSLAQRLRMVNGI